MYCFLTTIINTGLGGSLGPPKSTIMIVLCDLERNLVAGWEWTGAERDMRMGDQLKDTHCMDSNLQKNSKPWLAIIILQESYESRKPIIWIYFICHIATMSSSLFYPLEIQRISWIKFSNIFDVGVFNFFPKYY